MNDGRWPSAPGRTERSARVVSVLLSGASERGGDQGFLGVFGSGSAGFRFDRSGVGGELGARFGRLGGELGGFFFLFAFLTVVAKLEAFAGLVGCSVVTFARPDFTLGETEVIDERDV